MSRISFLNNFINKEVGVTTRKKTAPIIIGDMKFPKKIPNLCHSLLSGFNKLELITPKKSKTKDMHNDHNLTSPPDFNGQSPIIKKTTKNTKPKLRFDDIFISDFDFMIKYKLYLIIYFVTSTEKKPKRRPIPLSFL